MKRYAPLLLLLSLGASGEELDQPLGFHSSKMQAFEQCENWKDNGNTVNYSSGLNMAEASAKFGVNYPEPKVMVYGNLTDKINSTSKWEQWNIAREQFLATQPSKRIRLYARTCIDKKRQNLFLGFENKLIQSGAWQDEDGLRGKPEVVKTFRY